MWVIVLVIVAGVIAIVGGVVGAALTDTGSDDTPSDDSAAVGFARDMRVHHTQAVTMAEIVRDRTADDSMRVLATDIALTQQAQIGRMAGWLELWGRPLNRSGVEPMAWVGDAAHGHAPDGDQGAMPGMATNAEIEELRTLPVAEAEARFLELMIAHHRGGVAMAEAALVHDLPDAERRLAETIVTSQSSEIAVMTEMLAARGVEA